MRPWHSHNQYYRHAGVGARCNQIEQFPIYHPPLRRQHSSTCAPAVFTYPLTIPPDIRDTFGPWRLLPEGCSRYDFHCGLDWPAAEDAPVRAVTIGLQVAPGQIIGWVGDTSATYAHLPFEVRQGMTVAQRATIHPLNIPFLLWTNTGPPTVKLRGVYIDAIGLTALVEVSSPTAGLDVTAVSVTAAGAITDSRAIDYLDLNASLPSSPTWTIPW